jgi:hypothetical protein
VSACSRLLTGSDGYVANSETEKPTDYASYRYSSEPGWIIKTNSIFSQPTTQRPFVGFSNKSQCRGGAVGSSIPRNSTGFAFGLQSGVFCITIMVGLVLTIDEKGNHVTSRIS